jgi:hypothetical protein
LFEDDARSMFDEPWDGLIEPFHIEEKFQPGVPLDVAVKRLERWEGEGRGQQAAIDYLRTGVWSAFCQRAHLRVGSVAYFGEGEFAQALRKLDKEYTKGFISRPLPASHLTQKFWRPEHKNAGSDWELGEGFMWPDGARMQLERGLVETFTGFFHDDDQIDAFRAVRATAYGVQIYEYDVEAVAPQLTSVPVVEGRKTVYDWEAAFADVAAELYHRIEFANLDAKGVQTEIIGLLRASFEERQLSVPTDDTLKPKARKLLGALRAKKP